MTTLLALATLAAAAPPAPTPWPSDAPFVYEFTYGIASVFTTPGEEIKRFTPPPARFTWTCTAKPARKSGRQEVTCAEPGTGEIWMVWGPGRQLLELDVDEASDEAATDGAQHRVKVLAGALELWPEAPVAGAAWEQGGRHFVLKPAPNTTSSAFALKHAVASVEGARASITSTGTGTMVVGNSVESRVELGAEGEAVFDTTRGLLLERAVRVYPTRIVAGMYGTMGHEVTVKLGE